jgi:hypothetical protein
MNEMRHVRFTGPQQRDKALRTFQGFLDGIAADGIVNGEEVREIRDWIVDHQRLAKDTAFADLLTAASRATEDGKLDPEEVADLRWLCSSAASGSPYFNEITRQIQEFHGMLHGVVCDRRIPEVELRKLVDWIEDNRHLRGCYPVTEIESVIVSVLADGVISSEDETLLRNVFENFCTPSENYVIRSLKESGAPISISGICSVDPEIVIEGRHFCFTGISQLRSRAELHALVESRGGIARDTVVGELDYLVVCETANRAWAFCAYGRKVEKAMQMRKAGGKVLVIREQDLKDAL